MTMHFARWDVHVNLMTSWIASSSHHILKRESCSATESDREALKANKLATVPV